jgi:cytidyltransferase-like protein
MKIIASGTFDHLHEGHEYFLAEAFKHGYVMIGLCADSMLDHKKFPEKIYSYRKRKADLLEYLTGEGHISGKDYQIRKILNKIGFADDIEDIDAILVTSDVKKNAEEINEIRKAKNWKELQIIEIDLLRDDKGVISSTRMRQSGK